MQRSTDRMLTTHAGSLPRPSDLDAMLRANEAGQPHVAEAVPQQAEHGLDIADEAFLPAVAGGTVEHWLANAYYPSDEAFLFALADALHWAKLQALAEGARLASARLWGSGIRQRHRAVLQRPCSSRRGLAGDTDAGVARLGYHLSAYKRT